MLKEVIQDFVSSPLFICFTILPLTSVLWHSDKVSCKTVKKKGKVQWVEILRDLL